MDRRELSVQTGMFGTESIISYNGNKINIGSSGGMLLTDSEEEANKIREWSIQSRGDAAWYQHGELIGLQLPHE